MVNARRADCDDGVPSTPVIVASVLIRQTISDRFHRSRHMQARPKTSTFFILWPILWPILAHCL